MTITSTFIKALGIIGMDSLMVIIEPTIEVGLGDIAVNSGEFYKFLMGMDVVLGL